MEVVLNRLRDFSCKEATFDDHKAAVILREQPLAEKVFRDESANSDHPGHLKIESALAWLRQELIEMRYQDQALIRQLMNLHAGIQELKQECAVDEEEEEQYEEEEQSWDSESEESESSVYSGEMSFYSSMYSPCRRSPLHLGLPPRRSFGRRSSVP